MGNIRMKQKISERRLADVMINYLRKENHVVAREVQYYGKSIDIVAMPFDSDRLIAVEVKVANWKKAIKQAAINQTVAEECYVAMYAGYIHRVDLQQLQKCELGLISVGATWGDVRFIAMAKPSQYINSISNEIMKESIQGRRKENQRG